MGSTVIEPIDLMVAIIKEHTPRSIWIDSPLEGYRYVGMTNRGEIGEEFIARYLTQAGVSVQRGSRVAPTDLQIAGQPCEIKTASLGATGTFQFNHVRLDKPYRYLLCLGICPNELVFAAWTKAEVEQGIAGTLVHMAESQRTTLKLTKRVGDLHPIAELTAWVNAVVVKGE